MVRPAAFGFNADTARSNAFQKKSVVDPDLIGSTAVEEFDRMVEKLRHHDIEVIVLDEKRGERTSTDSVFPNNVFSTHPEGKVCWYPMASESRRSERTLIASFVDNKETLDLTDYEESGKFLEGTGSLILDHENRLAFACRSLRTDEDLVREWSDKMGYRPIVFDAVDHAGIPIYHTNVMMCLGDGFAVVNLNSIPDQKERKLVLGELEDSGREVVHIGHVGMHSFAGNMIEIKNRKGVRYLLMSKTAFDSLTTSNRNILEQKTNLLWFEIPTIETSGGGSVRCMVAELFF